MRSESSYAELHPPHFSPGHDEEERTDASDGGHFGPHGRPAAGQQGVAHNFDVVLAPDDVGEPADRGGDVVDREQKTREEKDQEEASERYGLDGGRLVGGRA